MFLATLFSLFSSTDYTTVDFATLRQGCLEGTEAARRALITRYESVAWRAVRARMNWASHEDQEEVVADTFIALLRDDAALLGRYDPLKGLSPEGWVRRQATLQANNKARGLSTIKRRSEVLAPSEEEAGKEVRFASSSPDPETELIDSQSLQSLFYVLEDRLSPSIALTFEMLYVRELDASAAAQAMGCSVDTVYTRKRRLVAAVDTILKERQMGAGD